MSPVAKTIRIASKWILVFTFAVCCAAAAVAAEPGGAAGDETSRFALHGIWRMQSSCVDKSPGDAISTVGFADKQWHKAEVPGTVVGALVEDKTLPDPDFGTNLKSFQGADIGGEEPFSNRDMPANSPYRCSYWFRMEFESPRDAGSRESWLSFLGINYRANIWLNGKKIADRGDVVGAYRTYEFRVRELLNKSGHNALAVEVFAPEKNDLGLTWVDWNPTPPDKDMGIWREVYLTTTGAVTLRAPFVSSKLDSDYKTAALTASAELRNTTDHVMNAVLRTDIGGVMASQTVELAAGEVRIVRFAPEQFPQLKLPHPKLWWPYQMGEPYLYTAKFSVEEAKEISDSATMHFGIREVTSELTPSGGRLFKVNGKRVLIRGAAWAPDMMLRWSSKKLDADLAYTRDMGLNTIRLEGKVDREEFFDKTVGTLARLDSGNAQGGCGFDGGSDYSPAKSSQRFCLAVRQRRPAAGRRGANVSGYSEKTGLAESVGFFRVRNANQGHRKFRGENDRTL
jgi:exo-1,4-beta-D-glucosaminidase